MGYDAKKAATFNKLRQQGLSEDAAATQAGITDADFGNYAIGSNGQMGATIAGAGKVAGVDYDKVTAADVAESNRFNKGLESSSNFEQVDYAEDAKNPPSRVTPINYTTTSTETVSGGGTTTITAGPRVPNAASQSLQPAINAKQAEIDQFQKDNPSDFARKKQGLPPLTPEEKQQRQEKLDQLTAERGALKNQQIDAESTTPPTTTTTPNTTTTTQTVTTGTTSTNQQVDPETDQKLSQENETQLDATPSAANAATAREATPVSETTVNDEGQIVAVETAEPVDPGVQSQTTVDEFGQVVAVDSPAPVGVSQTTVDEFGNTVPNPDFPGNTGVAAAERDSTAAMKARVKSQGTLQSRYKQPGNGDWRVRLSLAPYSDYLYNATDAGILAPLTATNGVIFPYTPNISTTYSANYDKYDLIHSNYRGLFYKSSSVGDLQIRGTFTAQDTREAAYMLAVIHFFRSVTKMFYGQDAERGTPPPLVYLSGYGDQQFSSHTCVVGSFNYSLPNEVDYIRTNGPNNFGPNMSNRQTPTASSPGGANFAGAIRLANALLRKGAIPQLPAPNSLRSAVNNTNECTYVPTKMEIDITLIPVQTRSQVSKQFSLKEFASGNLLKKGFW